MEAATEPSFDMHNSIAKVKDNCLSLNTLGAILSQQTRNSLEPARRNLASQDTNDLRP
jgi:hypothetical protein